MGFLGKKAIGTVLLVVFAVTIAASIIPVQAPPPTQHPISAKLSEYYPMSLFGSGEIPVDQTTYVLHGWVTGPGPGLPDHPLWSAMTGEQKGEFLATANFELFIGTDPVELKRLQWYDGPDLMTVVYYVVFPPYTFTGGEVITGYWSIEFNGQEFNFDETITVVPT